jgi:thiamine biosynthesis lipoprotein
MRPLPADRFRARSAPAANARREFLASLIGAGGPAAPAAAVADAGYRIRVHRRAMACRFEITLAASGGPFVAAARSALDEIDRLEDELSVFRGTSAISALNARAADGPVAVSASLVELLAHCADVHRDTGGAFDITTTPLSRCWGFLRREGRLPEAAEIDAARALVGLDAVSLDRERGTVAFTRRGVELNLGAIGKGYALDRAAGVLRQAGVGHALLSAGSSSLVAIGGGEAGWLIDLVSSLVPGRAIASVRLRDAALGTSGAGEQFVIAGGRRYGHVIDPRTGWPAAGVLSASVVASDAARADALSTAFLVGGLALAERYCASHPGVLAVVTPDDGSGRPAVFGSHPGARLLAG